MPATEDYGVTIVHTAPNQNSNNVNNTNAIHDPQKVPESSFCSCCCLGRCVRNKSLRDLWYRNKRLLRVMVVIVFLLNIPYGNYIMYPFQIFSTWIHECFHGLAAVTVGGEVAWLKIFPNGSGLAYTSVPNSDNINGRLFCVKSAGYCGTAITGGIMLFFRKRGYRVGTVMVGLCLILSGVLVVRNVFGIIVTCVMGIVLLLGSYFLPRFWAKECYATLAATTCLNAVMSIQALYDAAEVTVDGVTMSSDAGGVQEITGIHYWVVATAWWMFALLCTVLGIAFQLEAPLDEDATRSKNKMEEEETDDMSWL